MLQSMSLHLFSWLFFFLGWVWCLAVSFYLRSPISSYWCPNYRQEKVGCLHGRYWLSGWGNHRQAHKMPRRTISSDRDAKWCSHSGKAIWSFLKKWNTELLCAPESHCWVYIQNHQKQEIRQVLYTHVHSKIIHNSKNVGTTCVHLWMNA